ncbi:MAG TPA: beta-glucosidase, partial [Caldithrix abyssi]|nr:beta-glucosidase [Caldithrix abyssi]
MKMFFKLTLILILVSSNLLIASDFEKYDQKIADLLKRMTLKEKIGQMTQVTLEIVAHDHEEGIPLTKLKMDSLRIAVVKYGVGSILNTNNAANSAENWIDIITTIQRVATEETRLGIPVLYGIDAIHGSNYIAEATLFPQSIAMAATFNRKLVRKEGYITAIETRAVGIPWNFNPVLGLGRQPLWSRFWETYGEDVYLTKEMGREYILGLQGEDGDISQPDRVAACMKHYAG